MCFSSAHGTFIKVDQVCSHKTCHSEFTIIKIIQIVSTGGSKLNINKRKWLRKYKNIWKLNNTTESSMGKKRNHKGDYKIL